MMPKQTIIYADEAYRELDEQLACAGIRHLLLVCGGSIRKLRIDEYFRTLEARLGIRVTRFSDFAPNPLYESVTEGIRLFHAAGCDGVMAVGGGSAMDVAKCIKLYALEDGASGTNAAGADRGEAACTCGEMQEGPLYFETKPSANDIPLFAMPTTAGTGSEATRFAVIYYRGNKQSVTHDSIIPSVVVFDPSVLDTLPDYQRKVTMLDALCHAVESCWSVNADENSRSISLDAIRMILAYQDAYLANITEGNRNMLLAAHMAGRAINLTQTTAGHAMCYKLTSLYGIAHGHAAALCVKALWPYMLGHSHGEDCVDRRGEEYLQQTFRLLADAFGCGFGPGSQGEAADRFAALVDFLDLPKIGPASEEEIAMLTAGVNPVRLKNHPVRLGVEAIESLYREILN